LAILSFFGLLSMLKKLIIFRLILEKYFQNIHNILTKCYSYFNKFSSQNWPLFDFFHFWGFGYFSKHLMAKFIFWIFLELATLPHSQSLWRGGGLGCVMGWRGGGKEDVRVVLERMFLEVSRCREMMMVVVVVIHVRAHPQAGVCIFAVFIFQNVSI